MMKDSTADKPKPCFTSLTGDTNRIAWLREEIAIHQAQAAYYSRLLTQEEKLQNE